MSNEMTIDSIGKRLESLGATLELVFHGAEQETPFTERLSEVVGRLEQAAGGALSIDKGQGGDMPGVTGLTIAHEGRGKINYMALPEGPEEAPFVEALIEPEAGGADRERQGRLAGLSKPAELMVFMASACPHCPGAVRAANQAALMSPSVTTTIIDAQLFPHLAERFGAKSVPLTVLDQGLSITGVVSLDELIDRIVERGSSDHGARTLLSLVEQERLQEAAALVTGEGGHSLFAEAWQKSATSSRIGFMVMVEEILEEDPRALDQCVSGLLPALESDDAALRGDTADLLGQIGHPAARGALEELLDDPNPDVAEIAREALDEMDEDSG